MTIHNPPELLPRTELALDCWGAILPRAVRDLFTDLARSVDAARVENADLRARLDLLESSRHD